MKVPAAFAIIPLLFVALATAGANNSPNLRRAAIRAIADGNTALYAALLQAGLEINQSIVDAPADGHGRDRNFTSLMFAVAWGKADMVAWLRDQGALPHESTTDNIRPIDLALSLKRDDMAQLLSVPAKPTPPSEQMPEEAVRALGDLFRIPNSLQVYVSLNGGDPDDAFTQKIVSPLERTFPMSMARSDPGHILTLNGKRYWFANRISGKIGVRFAVTAKRLQDKNAWDVTCQLEGRPVAEKQDMQPIPMPVEKVSGRLIQKYGWWVLEERQPRLRNPVPAPPKAETRQADLGPLAADACWLGNVALIHALIDAGLDPTRPNEPENEYSNTLLETAAWSTNPRLVPAILKKTPALLSRRDLLRKAAQPAYEQGNESALAAMERPLSGVKAGVFPIEMIDDLLIVSPEEAKEPLFVTFNGADPDKAVMECVKKHWKTAIPFSDAVTEGFKQQPGEVYGSSYHERATGKNGTKMEIKITAEANGTWSFSVRGTRGFLAGGGTKGTLVFSHNFWLKKDEQSWDE